MNDAGLQAGEEKMSGREVRSVPEIAWLVLAAALTILLASLGFEVASRMTGGRDGLLERLPHLPGIITGVLTAIMVAIVARRQQRRGAALLKREAVHRAAKFQEAQAILDLVFDSTPSSLMLLDSEFKILKANRAAERVHGAVLEKRRCHEAIAGRHERCDDCPGVATLENGIPGRVAGEHADPRTGEILAAETHRLQLPDGRNYLLLVEQSLTEQKKLEARLLHQEKMAAFGLLAAGVAHDMGNPLSSIGAQLQLLDDEAIPEDLRDVIATVRQETERLRRILRELVDFARRRRDQASLIPVQGVVNDALRLLRHDHRMRNVRIIEEFSANTPPVFMVEDHLMQVVLNLLLNALDAMTARGAWSEGGSLRIEILPAGGRVVLRVHDTGQGMERSVLDRCFEALYTTKGPGKGTGLGLSICKDIIEAAGGRIELHSAPGQGTTAMVMLPEPEEVARGSDGQSAVGAG